jgi:hypothetical protein
LREAAHQGLAGVMDDIRLLSQPWEFRLSEVRAPVEIFAGTADPWATPEMTHWLQVELPSCCSRLYAGGGHFTVLLQHTPDALEGLRLGQSASRDSLRTAERPLASLSATTVHAEPAARSLS